MTPEDIEILLKAIPKKVLENTYDDVLSKPLTETGKAINDIVKTARLIAFPIQITAYLQDRLSLFLSKSINKVPENRLISPNQSLLLSTLDQLKYKSDNDVIAELYLNLLARSMDKERLNEAHPAFLNIISQLSPDEVQILNQIKFMEYFFLIYEKQEDAVRTTIDKNTALESIFRYDNSPELKNILTTNCFDYDSIAQGELINTFVEHLISLGLIKFDFSFELTPQFFKYKAIEKNTNKYRIKRLVLTRFGDLFTTSCIETEKFN